MQEVLPKPVALVARELQHAVTRAFYDTALGYWWDDLLLKRDMEPLKSGKTPALTPGSRTLLPFFCAGKGVGAC